MNEQDVLQSAPPELDQAPTGVPEQSEEHSPAQDATQTQDESTSEKEQKRRDNGFQRRINEIVKDREQFKAQADQERRERMRIMDLLEQQNKRSQPEATKQSGGEMPKIENFERYEDFLAARAEYAAEQKFRQITQGQQQERDRAAHQQVLAEQHRQLVAQQQTLQKLVDNAEKKYPDFYEKVFTQDPSVVPISPVVGNAILECEVVNDVDYFLATHPAEAQRIAKLSPTSQLREVGKLEVSLAKQQSAAPPPINPISGKRVNDAGPTGEESNFKDFLAKRNRQLGRK